MWKGDNARMKGLIDHLVEVSLFSDKGTEIAREKLGYSSVQDMVDTICDCLGCTIKEAQQRILGDSLLLKVAFSVA